MKYVLIGLALTFAVTALPNGAPACNIGEANIQDNHLSPKRNPRNGTIETGKYQVTLSGRQLITLPSDPTFANLFQIDQDLPLVIQSLGVNNYMKGILVIASGGNRYALDTRTPLALNITDPVGTNESFGCENYAVSSISHIEPSEKNSIAMSFKWPNEGQKLFLDVNIVKNNNATFGSEFYFSQYPMVAISPPTSSPRSPPTSTPRSPPTSSPRSPPTSSPRSPPTSSPQCVSYSCGLLGLNIFCPLTQCGILGRVLGLCQWSEC